METYKFKCQESCGGQCCKPGWAGASFIFLTESDAVALEQFTGLDRKQFSAIGEFDWTRFSKGKTRARYMRGCQFFEGGKCSVYEARPIQCRTFPYWPENIRPENWDKLADSCPGIGKGDAREPGEIQTITGTQVKADREY